MKTDFFSIYDALIDGVSSTETIQACTTGAGWAMVETAKHIGIAMDTEGESISPVYSEGLNGLGLREAAEAAKSWNLKEASFGLAAINAFYNTAERMERLCSFEPFENYSTKGVDFDGKTVALIGHLKGPEGLRDAAKKVYIIERDPRPGDYPDSACDLILPQCDIVIITGSSLVNKTLPHLLSLCQNAFTILTGPSVPMCTELLSFGIDRLSGMIISDRPAMKDKVINNLPGSPYPFGTSFLLKADDDCCSNTD